MKKVKSVLKFIEYEGGTINVLYREGAARPYQICVSPLDSYDAPSRFVSLKTEEACIKRLNAEYEKYMELTAMMNGQA